MQKNDLWRHPCIILATAAGGAALLMTAGWNGNSQGFTPSRYAVVAAEIDVSMPQTAGINGNPRKVLVRLDTHSGAVSILQLSVAGINNPAVRSASWAKVHEHNTLPDNN